MVTASDFTSQLAGTISLVPPKMVVISMVTFPLISAWVRFSSVPPKMFTISPPLKSLERRIFLSPPKMEVESTKSSLLKV